MPAGYSQRSLADKLGIKPAMRIAIINAPSGYEATLGRLPGSVKVFTRAARSLDLVHAFFLESHSLIRQFPALKNAISHDGALWISWPKKAAKAPTDLDENIVRSVGLENGLVDIKVCAVDEVWSGLKFVYRKSQRNTALSSC